MALQNRTLQNRVDPFGMLHAEPAYGIFTGNRGIIHDPATRTLLARRWTSKAWITCSLSHPRGARRQPMGRNGRSGRAGWTELFFLDEVTALAAGHRPCFYCRRAAAQVFAACFAACFADGHIDGHRGDDTDIHSRNIGHYSGPAMSAAAMDAILHRQRLACGAKAPRLGREEMALLPDGAMISATGMAWAIRQNRALPWTFAGYRAAQDLPHDGHLITPLASVAALRAGFAPVWHPSVS